MTESTLSQRLTFHRQRGLIWEHHRRFHNENISRNTLIENTKIIIENNRKELLIKEALNIQEKRAIINIQNKNFTNF